MELTSEKTEYIIIKAGIQSEWDNLKYAIIHVTDDLIQKVKRIDEHAKQLNEIGGFYNVQFFWHGSVVFLTGDYRDQNGDEQELFPVDIDDDDNPFGDEDWSYVKLDAGELDAKFGDNRYVDDYMLVRPQNVMGTLCLCVSGGVFYFTAHGKYSGEDVWTESLGIAEFEGKSLAV